MKVLVNNLSQSGNVILNEANFEVITTKVAKEQLANYINNNQIDVVVFETPEDFNAELVDTCSSLKLIAFKNLIEENSDIQYAKDQGLYVIDATKSSAIAIAEMTFAHLFGMVRFLHQSNREMPLEGDINFRMLQKAYKGTELKGKTIGIIGMNAAGIETAKIALGIGMKVIMTNHEPKSILIPIDFFDGQSIDFSFEAVELNKVLTEADFITIHTNAFDEYIIDTPQFEKLKNGVGIINMVQGAINEVTLINAIEAKKVKFAALDAFEKQPTPEIQLLMNPEISLSPNVSLHTFETEERISIELANQIVNLL